MTREHNTIPTEFNHSGNFSRWIQPLALQTIFPAFEESTRTTFSAVVLELAESLVKNLASVQIPVGMKRLFRLSPNIVWIAALVVLMGFAPNTNATDLECGCSSSTNDTCWCDWTDWYRIAPSNSRLFIVECTNNTFKTVSKLNHKKDGGPVTCWRGVKKTYTVTCRNWNTVFGGKSHKVKLRIQCLMPDKKYLNP